MKSVILGINIISLKIVLCCLCFSVLVIHSNTTQAASLIADTPCDSLYYETLSSRAWLEAQREITQNQNIILKPDSVFEYTCFDLFLRELADHAAQMLSESGSYGTPLNLAAMDNALTTLVENSVNAYIMNNFENAGGFTYDLLGGHPAAIGIDHTPAGGIFGGTYSCDIMGRVWQAAKCINFVTNSATDGFYTFAEYQSDSTDKRRLPVAACGSITPTVWGDNIAVGLTTGPWTNDPLQTYLSQTVPDAGCTGSPIPTGITVNRSGVKPNNYDEKICLQPGCRFDPTTNDCVSN
ncbi:MAG: hypothetical protein OEY94_00965 [Alphaproteobacteria bacterium]|nr:hypothetical protein [Alphaproteobacteria bacterium]